MNILILGATGFIGNGIFHTLISSRYSIFTAGRTQIDGYKKWMYLDFKDESDWEKYLENIDLVINAIGIIEGDFSKIQTESPISFYKACVKRNTKIIHISAVGAEKDYPPNEFLRSKKKTDEFLLTYKNAKIIYPGIVIGRNGKSSQFLTEISSLPLIPIFGNTNPPTIHLNQLTMFVEEVVRDFHKYPQQLFAVSKPESFKSLFMALKGKKPFFISIPVTLIKLFFFIFPKAKIGIFSKEMLTMNLSLSAEEYWNLPENANSILERINPKNQYLRESTTKFIDSTKMTKSDSLSYIMAILSISFIWIWSAISSMISWKESYSLMQEIGANDFISIYSIYLGSIVDFALGIAIFNKTYRKEILLFQILFITTYTMILSVLAPHYWLHPFGVIAKNIPLIALSYYVFRKESD